MKKTIIFSLICCTLFITGCGCGKKNKIIVHKCSNQVQNDNYLYEVNYEMKSSDDDTLLNYTRKEVYSSDDADFLTNMDDYKNNYFSELKKLNGVEYSSSILDNNKLETTLTIDFSIVDYDKLCDLDNFYLNFYDDETQRISAKYAIDYYIGDDITCS